MLGQAGTWVGASARQIARAVRRGDTSATAVIADHLDYIHQYDKIVYAFRQVRAMEALSEAEAVDEQRNLDPAFRRPGRFEASSGSGARDRP